MILRRLSASVRTQDWFAVALELVVVGIFLGLEVSTWNEARADRSRSAAYLDRIEADLVIDVAELQKRISFWNEVARNGRIALAYAEESRPGEKSAWTVLRAFIHASQVWRFTFNATTYSELRSAGELALIDDPELRASLAGKSWAAPFRRWRSLEGKGARFTRRTGFSRPSVAGSSCRHRRSRPPPSTKS